MELKKDIVVLDLESTGVWIEKDKIIEIALIRYEPSGAKKAYHKRVNPGIPIPEAIEKLTGVTNAAVKDAPFFNQIAKEIFQFIGSADFGGFNIERFDLPLLEREFADAGIKFEWKERKIYDAQKVYHLNEKRDLSAAYKFYCGKDLVGAHSALADTEAALEILQQQVIQYGGGRKDIDVLDQFEYSVPMDFYDSERKFCWWNGKLYPMFGKYARKVPLEDIVKTDAGYLYWVLKSNFSEGIKSVIQSALDGELPVRRKPN